MAAPSLKPVECGDGSFLNLASTFQPSNHTNSPPTIQLPGELWLTVLESPCTFPPEIFSGVMLNLIKNPNVTSSHLFRADVFYDSDSDRALGHARNNTNKGGLVSHLKPEYHPQKSALPGYELERTIVRQLVPRNPQLDRPLIQTCHFFRQVDEDEERSAVIYIPHVEKADETPFYHPTVRRLAFLHKWRTPDPDSSDKTLGTGTISLSYNLFQDTALTTKLERTALKLLETVHKHGQGQLAGYEKRVHLDQIIPQKRYQDTYARLKAKYGKRLAEQWVEVTDPGKHVFEDIGIAAFLIELWRDMYGMTPASSSKDGKSAFPGFVDIGCGNGLLVYILLAEGYEGWGFDARERKTWRNFPDDVQERLQRRLLVPKIFQDKKLEQMETIWHNGLFDTGTFIISNHADELTAWTPLLAYLNQSSFIAIPCCSHNLAGARFRAPLSTKRAKSAAPLRLPQQSTSTSESVAESGKSQAAETGSLERTEAQKKMPSAYSTLCSYVTSLAEEAGYEAEKDVLRIPSTRNQCIIGRWREDSTSLSERVELVSDILEREVGDVGAEWIERAEKLAKKPGSGH